MPIKANTDCALWSTIRNGEFCKIPEDDLIHQIYAAFPQEIDRIKNAATIERSSPPLIAVNGDVQRRTPSEVLFDENYDEVNRTLVGVLALRWLQSSDYDRFTQGQSDELRLSKDSFNALKQYYRTHIESEDDQFCLVLSMIVNDLGKDPRLCEDLWAKTARNLVGANHDTILLEAAKEGLVNCLEKYLDGEHKREVLLGLELGSELNAAQLAQAENVPVNLEGLLNMRNEKRAFHLKFMEQILDVAGAAGHSFSNGAKNLIEPVYQAFWTVKEVSLAIIEGRKTLREGYDMVLINRAELLHSKGFRMLDVNKSDERALLRLLTMGRTVSKDQADLFDEAFRQLEKDKRALLIHGLNIDAVEENEIAVLPYYMPAMLSETLQSTKNAENRTEALTSLMRYLGKVLEWTDEHEQKARENGQSDSIQPLNHQGTWPISGHVYERNMIMIRETIRGDQFKSNPRILDSLDLPEAQKLMRRRTSQSV